MPRWSDHEKPRAPATVAEQRAREPRSLSDVHAGCQRAVCGLSIGEVVDLTPGRRVAIAMARVWTVCGGTVQLLREQQLSNKMRF